MNIQNIIDEKLESIRKNDIAIDGIVNAVALLQKSGALEFLKLLIQARVIGDISNAQVQAVNFAYIAGANDLIEKLVYFKELFLQEVSQPKQPALSFGSLEKAVLTGDLTKEEADAIRRGESVDYSKYYSKTSSGPSA